MVRLFVSDRIFIDGGLLKGGIAVNEYGKIDGVLKTETEVAKWLKKNGNVEVIT